MDASLQQVINELEGVPSEELTRVDAELRILTGLLFTSKQLASSAGNLDQLDTATRILERCIKAKQRSQKLQREEKSLVPVSDVQAFLEHIDNTLFEGLDTETASDLAEKIRTFRLSEPVQP